jgi:predicted RND superfamily exporter protein
MVGFSSLAWTTVPAVRSLGFAVAVGIAACLFASFFIVVPALFLFTRTTLRLSTTCAAASDEMP